LRGTTFKQIERLYERSGINAIGASKHDAKEVAREGGAQTWQEIGREVRIYSYGTADTYRDVWRSALDFAKSEHGIKDVEKLTPEAVQGYLESRVEQGVAHSTYQKEAAALAKLEQTLNRYSEAHDRGNTYDFRSAIAETRAEAHTLSKFDSSRAYEDARGLVAAVSDRDHQITAAVQLESGSRIHEASLIKPDQLQGYRPDPTTGDQRGVIAYQGKGGKVGEHLVRPETYRAIEQRISERGEYRIGKDAYRDSLKAAAAATGQEYTGSHGLRWSYAQERFAQIQEHGDSYEKALAQVSQEMGHVRASITEHYLR
jgi:integrase